MVIVCKYAVGNSAPSITSEVCTHFHGRVTVVGGGAGGQLDSCDAKAPNVCFEVVASYLGTVFDGLAFILKLSTLDMKFECTTM